MSQRQQLAPPTDQYRATIDQSIEIDASPDAIFSAVLHDMTAIPDGNGKHMNFVFEPFPGGRWYRDLGNNAGHLWGHVQVIKPPTLLEIYGPLMISSAALSHVTYRITSENNASILTITHKLFGDFDPQIPSKVGGGWKLCLDRIKKIAQSK